MDFFRRRSVFKLTCNTESQKLAKICFGGRATFYGKNIKISPQHDSQHRIHVFLSSFVEAEVTKQVFGISYQKAVVFGYFLRDLLERSSRKFSLVTLSPLSIPLPIFIQIRPVSWEI